MKKIIYSLFSLCILSASVQAQTKKVMLEDFTGTWCGWCPEGTVIVESLHAANLTNFIPVASHYNDPLQIPEGLAINDGIDVTGYPNGAVDRFKFPSQAKIPMSRGQWSSSFNTRKSTPAIVSVSFSNPVVTGTTYTAKVNVKFTSAPTAGIPIKMNVYLTEDSIPATGANAQGNYSSAVQGGASPLTNWFHNATLRKALGGAWGFSTTVPATPVVGTMYSENISFTIPSGWVKKNINVIAFVAYDGPATSFQKEVMNAEQYPLKYWYPTAVQDVQEENQMALNLYPNPATPNSFIKFAFTMNDDAVVKMEVLNSFGQIISKPYSSFEIKGSHTIQWSPREYSASIAPGMYFVRISTDKGQSSVSTLMIN